MLIGLLIGILIGAIVNGILIWIVGKLGLGMEVDGFGPAFIVGLVIAVIGGLVNWLLGALGITIGGGLLGAIINLLIAAVVLTIGSGLVSGVRVKGFGGAIIAAVAIGVVTWLIALLLAGMV